MNPRIGTSPLRRVLEALEGANCAPRKCGGNWLARCPAHADRSPSLSVREGDDGRALLHCFAGCEFEQVLQALGLATSELFASGRNGVPRGPGGHPRVHKAARLEKSPPPQHEVHALWTRCRPFHEDADTSAWARARGLDPNAIADRDLCRALPRDGSNPAWARLRGAPWPLGGYRAIAPLYDARGGLTSLHARNVNVAVKPKGGLPAKCSAAGLVLADSAGLMMLRTSELHGPLWIVEGVPDFLCCACSWSDSAGDAAPAILGVVSGSWTPEMAARVPSGARVVIAVHHDGSGQGYCAKIDRSLERRCSLGRWSPPRGWR